VTVNDFRDLFSYDEWANERLFRAVEALSDEQFTRRVASSLSSLRDTLSHIVAEEWVWLRRCMGEDPTRPAGWTAMSSRADLIPALETVRRDRSGFLVSLTTDALSRVVAFKSLEGHEHAHRIENMLRHVLHHSAYHRGQAATLLRQVGAVAPETDYVVYCESARSRDDVGE
jgi:uncharacterized damage-inducible protein DinB